MAVPPLSGLRLKVDATGFCVMELTAVAEILTRLYEGSLDQGPVHATTTRMMTMYGLQARSAARESIGASAAACAPRLRATAAPPNARIVLGRQIFVNPNSSQNDASISV